MPKRRGSPLIYARLQQYVLAVGAPLIVALAVALVVSKVNTDTVTDGPFAWNCTALDEMSLADAASQGLPDSGIFVLRGGAADLSLSMADLVDGCPGLPNHARESVVPHAVAFHPVVRASLSLLLSIRKYVTGGGPTSVQALIEEYPADLVSYHSCLAEKKANFGSAGLVDQLLYAVEGSAHYLFDFAYEYDSDVIKACHILRARLETLTSRNRFGTFQLLGGSTKLFVSRRGTAFASPHIHQTYPDGTPAKHAWRWQWQITGAKEWTFWPEETLGVIMKNSGGGAAYDDPRRTDTSTEPSVRSLDFNMRMGPRGAAARRAIAQLPCTRATVHSGDIIVFHEGGAHAVRSDDMDATNTTISVAVAPPGRTWPFSPASVAA